MSRLYTLSEGTAARRRFPIYLVDSGDGLTPETGESGGQPQISKVGGAWANTTATLTAVGNGHYYVELTTTELNTLGYFAIRYKSANTAEFNMDGQVISFDLMTAVAQTGDAYARLGAPAGASVSADILTIDNLVDDLESRLGTPSNLGSGATVAANLVDIEAQTDDIGAAGAGLSAIPAVTVGTLNANVVTASALATDAVNEIVDQVWDEALSGHLGAGSTGAALNGAGSAGDPWTTTLPGAYGAGTAGNILGNNLNATVSSRATQTSVDTVDDFLDTEVAAIKAKTDQLAFTGANKVDASVRDWLGTAPSALIAGRVDANAQVIGTDAVTSTALAASAVTEIQAGLATQASVDTIDDFLDTEIAAIKAKTDNLPASPAAVGSAMTLAADAVNASALAADAVTEIFVGVLRTALTEGYAADGALPTLEQLAFMLYSAVAQFAVSGTSISTKKLDGTTEAMVFTTDSASSPTSRVRTT